MNPGDLSTRPDPGTRSVDWASGVMLGIAVVVAFLSFLWPLLVAPSAALDGNALSPFIFAVLLPVLQMNKGIVP